MTRTINETRVNGVEEKMGTYEKKEGRFLLFFKTTWWEKVSEISLGNDIYIETERPIRNVYLNGDLLK